MKKQTKSTMQTLLQGILDRMKKVENFTLEQAPNICKEIVAVEVTETQNAGIVSAVIAAVTGLIAFLTIRYAFVAPMVPARYDGESMSHLAIFCSFAGIGALVVALLGALSTLQSVLKLREIKAGPKLLIIEKLSKLIKKV